MAISKVKGVKISGIASVLPANRVDNLNIVGANSTKKEALVLHTGIRFRHVVKDKNKSVKVLFKNAIDLLLEELNWNKSSVDVILVVTQTAKSTIPSIACQIHGEMEFSSNVLAYDINSGCSGFVYGLHTASQLLSSIDKTNKRAILCCGDISSSLIEDDDMAVKPIFSDAVCAIGLENDSQGESYFNLETFGKGQNAISLVKSNTGDWMRMDGIDVFNYAINYVPKNIKTLLDEYSEGVRIPDVYILHQANKLINVAIGNSIGQHENKVPSSLYDFGNTASASIPLTFSLSWENKKTGWALFSGFGVGFSVASALVKIDGIKIVEPQYINV